MKIYFNYIRLFLLAALILSLGNCYSTSDEMSTEIIDLSESEWNIDFNDNLYLAFLSSFELPTLESLHLLHQNHTLKSQTVQGNTYPKS